MNITFYARYRGFLLTAIIFASSTYASINVRKMSQEIISTRIIYHCFGLFFWFLLFWLILQFLLNNCDVSARFAFHFDLRCQLHLLKHGSHQRFVAFFPHLSYSLVFLFCCSSILLRDSRNMNTYEYNDIFINYK